MFDRHLLRIVLTAGALSLALGQASHAVGGNETVTLASQRIPLWPVYIAAVVATIIATYRIFRQITNRSTRTRVFPKVEFRRRLFAPYSGGNCAAIAFNPERERDDA